MTISKSILSFALSALVPALVSAPLAVHAKTEVEGWNTLWTESVQPTKGDSKWAEGLNPSDFLLTETETLATTNLETDEDSSSRDPASIKRLPKKISKISRTQRPAKNAKNQNAKSSLPHVTLSKKPAPSRLAMAEQGSTSSASTGEPAMNWPAGASEGFEFRVRYKTQISSMWVMKRGTNYDLVFATNGGSRVNVSIPPEQFHALKDAASQMRSPASDTSKCQDANVQLKVVGSGSPGKVSACLNAKGKAADQLRLLGTTLSTYVR